MITLILGGVAAILTTAAYGRLAHGDSVPTLWVFSALASIVTFTGSL